MMRKILCTVSLMAMLIVMLAVSVAAEIPAKPDGNTDRITAIPVIPSAALFGGNPIYTYNASADKLTVASQPNGKYYVNYPLSDSLTATSSYVINVDVTLPASARFDQYSGPIFVYRKNADGKYLGLFFQQNAVYNCTFTVAADGSMTFAAGNSFSGSPLPDGFTGSIKISSTPTRVNFSVYDEDGNAMMLKYTMDNGNTYHDYGKEYGFDIAGGAPAFGVASSGCKVTFTNAEVYDTAVDPVTTTTTGAATTTVSGATTTTVGGATTTTTTTVATTTTTKAPVDARPAVVPSVSGMQSLINKNSAFRTAAEGYTYKAGVLKGTGDPVLTREFGRFDLKGVSADDTYLISLKMKVDLLYDEFSGCYIGFRGKDGKDFLAMGFQPNAVYLMDYVSNNYASAASFTVKAQAPVTIEQGKTYKVDIFSTPTKVSLFVDSKLVLDYVTVEKHDPMLSVLSANANFELSNISLYNLSKAGTQDKVENSPNTGNTIPMMVVCVMIAAFAGIAVTFRRRSSAK